MGRIFPVQKDNSLQTRNVISDLNRLVLANGPFLMLYRYSISHLLNNLLQPFDQHTKKIIMDDGALVMALVLMLRVDKSSVGTEGRDIHIVYIKNRWARG